MALHVLFLLSGVTGLIYQVAWTRAFAFVFGNTTYAVGAVLAAFMAGLALGNWFFGRRVDRRPGDELGLYAVLEIGIAVSAVAVVPLLDLLDGSYGSLFRAAPHSLWLLTLYRGLLAFLLLLAPSFLMGGTLPVLCRYVIRRPSDLAGGVGALYGLNTAGAAAGCLVTGFLLVEHLGVRGSIAAAAALNLLLAAAFLLLRRAHRRRGHAPSPGPEATPSAAEAPAAGGAGALLLAVAAASGFAALGYEVLWTRLLVFKLKTTTYAFSVMLTTFLAGLALGGLLLGAWERRTRDRGSAAAWRRLSGLQAGIGLSALASIFVIGGLEGVAVAADGAWGARTLRQSGLAAAVMLPPTVMMGMSLPLVARLAGAGRGVGEAVGRVYAANTAGAVLGSLAGGFFLAPWLGTQYSLVLLACVNLVLAAAVLWASPVRGRSTAWRRGLISAWAAAALGLLMLPPDLLFGLYNAGEREIDSRTRILHAREGAGGITTVHELPNGDRVISTGSINVAGTTLTLRTTQMLQAHVPALLHPGPRRVLQIGFGSGETAHILSGYPGCSLDVAEISRSVLDEADAFFGDINHGVLRHPSVTPFVTDGASFLRLTRRSYDLILNDSIWPYYAGNSGLYTREHFAAGRDRLRPGGLMTSWLPLDMRLRSFLTILRTFHSVFPHFTIWAANTHYTKHALLVGSLEPLGIDAAGFLDRFRDRAGGLEQVHLGDPVLLLDCFLTDETGLAGELAGAPLHTVDRPVLEFAPSKPSLHGQLAVYELLSRERRPVTAYLAEVDPVRDSKLIGALERTREASALVVEATLRRERRQPGWQALLERARGLRPDHPGLRTLEERTGRLARVEETALEGRTYRELVGLADRQAKAGLHGRAAAALRRAIMQQPDRPRAHEDLGLVLAAAGDLAGASRALERALELAPGSAGAHLGLGNVRRRQGDRGSAAEHYRQALAADPGLAQAHFSLGTLLAEEGRRGEALAALVEALRLRPDYVRAHIAAGVLLDGEGRLDEAVGHFRKAVRLSPRDRAACNNLVVALAAAGLREEAVEQLAAARRRGVDMAVAKQVLGAPEAPARDSLPQEP